MTVEYSVRARRSLYSIWLYNAHRCGVPHADGYVAFVEKEIGLLGEEPYRGQGITGTSYHGLTVRRSRRGYGHVAVYRVQGERIIVLQIYHTAQDWRTKLEEL